MSDPIRKYLISTSVDSILKRINVITREKHLVLSFPRWMTDIRKKQLKLISMEV